MKPVSFGNGPEPFAILISARNRFDFPDQFYRQITLIFPKLSQRAEHFLIGSIMWRACLSPYQFDVSADELVRLQQAAEMVRDGTVASADGASINDRLTKAPVETQKVA